MVLEVFTERTLCPCIVREKGSMKSDAKVNEWKDAMPWRGFGGAPDYYNGVALVVTLCIDTARCSTGLIKTDDTLPPNKKAMPTESAMYETSLWQPLLHLYDPLYYYSLYQ